MNLILKLIAILTIFNTLSEIKHKDEVKVIIIYPNQDTYTPKDSIKTYYI